MPGAGFTLHQGAQFAADALALRALTLTAQIVFLDATNIHTSVSIYYDGTDACDVLIDKKSKVMLKLFIALRDGTTEVCRMSMVRRFDAGKKMSLQSKFGFVGNLDNNMQGLFTDLRECGYLFLAETDRFGMLFVLQRRSAITRPKRSDTKYFDATVEALVSSSLSLIWLYAHHLCLRNKKRVVAENYFPT
ncbi:hypothetical protein B0J17DRAFT_702907 [Rhizoctonia solani]|nr:hypothetical protein B0J17DRAFT_702907 [Rhizoctonia solani]